MNKVYIKGVPDRGTEVIAKLESLGGKNTLKLNGDKCNHFYFIDIEGHINFSMEKNILDWNGAKEIFLDEPKSTELKKYDPVMVSENGESWKIKIYLKENRCSSSIETIETYGNPWTYIVPISNFNFNNLKSNIKRSIL